MKTESENLRLISPSYQICRLCSVKLCTPVALCCRGSCLSGLQQCASVPYRSAMQRSLELRLGYTVTDVQVFVVFILFCTSNDKINCSPLDSVVFKHWQQPSVQ